MLKVLAALDWVVEVAEGASQNAPRQVLLVEPVTTPLVSALMLPRETSVEALWQGGALSEMTLADVLGEGAA